jgi:PTH1 family peptidyl-tRNA hydrolase
MPLLGSSPRSIPIFVASLGNPKPYLNTLHSAGHIVLSSIATREHLSAWRPFAGGQITEAGHAPQGFSLLGGYANAPATGQVALWKCGAMMNVSGPAVKKAWLKWKMDNGFGADSAEPPRLVIVHDELEKELGAVSVRTDHKASARGHNGLKSLMASMPEERFVRIGVGIGRPDSRERDAVSNYVLRKATQREVQTLEQASKEVRRQIEEVHEGAVG